MYFYSVGCAMGCRFCHTGSQKFTRNLTVGEIVGQFMVARDAYGEWPSPTDEVRYLSNIVVMGMGEPLNNLDNVVKALNIITDCEGIGISRRRVTMSTSGIASRHCGGFAANGSSASCFSSCTEQYDSFTNYAYKR